VIVGVNFLAATLLVGYLRLVHMPDPGDAPDPGDVPPA